MAGLCEGGNEPSGSLKASNFILTYIFNDVNAVRYHGNPVFNRAAEKTDHLGCDIACCPTNLRRHRYTTRGNIQSMYRNCSNELHLPYTGSKKTVLNHFHDDSLMLAGSEFQSLGRAIVKEDEYEEYVFPNSSHSCHYWRYRTYRHVLFRMNAVLASQLLCLLDYTPELRKCRKIEFSKLIS
ncbi:hypothetical protein ANN_20421 [Periplaneta americana]|uniref:Uncharacterized protein n=1 Tax=Periplaneta americana TaxID=6978 RepID=A0ABQ8SCJ1_PERAM|nr:hypothetical protein ANN_20421 [Periplaneta americana]